MIIKKGNIGEIVKEIQQILGFSKEESDGIFGEKTEKLVWIYQMQNNLLADGIVGRKTGEQMGLKWFTTDLTSKANDTTIFEGTKLPEIIYKNKKITIYDGFMNKNEYVHDSFIRPENVVLHHTAGWGNPFAVIKQWENDNRGRVGTNFVIGGPNIIVNKKDSNYDGIIAQAIPDHNYGYHIGGVPCKDIHAVSIGIEICNFGSLTKINNKYYAWPAFDSKRQLRKNYKYYEIAVNEVCILKDPFRGSKYYHKYSEAQLQALKYLLLYLKKLESTLDLTTGIFTLLNILTNPKRAFEIDDNAREGMRGMWAHANYRKDKSDLSPQPAMIELLKNLPL
jgi:peptidoglycan hydrolase-like protein with peptidoglycan-binding domain